jgi:hypothetical protein
VLFTVLSPTRTPLLLSVSQVLTFSISFQIFVYNNFYVLAIFIIIDFHIIDFVGIDSKTLKEEKREELFETLKTNDSIGWAVDVIDPKELSAKMLKK